MPREAALDPAEGVAGDRISEFSRPSTLTMAKSSLRRDRRRWPEADTTESGKVGTKTWAPRLWATFSVVRVLPVMTLPNRLRAVIVDRVDRSPAEFEPGIVEVGQVADHRSS